MTATHSMQAPTHVSFKAALLYWFKIGFISFGGPAGQISMMHEELVERRRWISGGRFLHALNYCMLLPGPEAQQHTALPEHTHFKRSCALRFAAMGAALWIGVMTLLFTLIEATPHTVKFTAPLTAITAAVVGVILNLALFFAYHVFWPQGFGASFAWFSVLLSGLAFIALIHYRIGVVTVIIACGTLGLLYSLVV